MGRHGAGDFEAAAAPAALLLLPPIDPSRRQQRACIRVYPEWLHCAKAKMA